MKIIDLVKRPKITTNLDYNQIPIDITEYKVRLQIDDEIKPFNNYNYNFMGCDPGTSKLGLAAWFFNTGYIYVWEIKMERQPNTEERMNTFLSLLDYFTGGQRMKYVTVEGAGYMSSQYRQVELEDIRASFVCWKHSSPETILNIVPPNSIRKVVFGSAKIKNPWEWEGIPDNASAALACALYPIMKEE